MNHYTMPNIKFNPLDQFLYSKEEK